MVIYCLSWNILRGLADMRHCSDVDNTYHRARYSRAGKRGNPDWQFRRSIPHHATEKEASLDGYYRSNVSFPADFKTEGVRRLMITRFGVGATVGPLLGGVFTDLVTWRWCFYLNRKLAEVQNAHRHMFSYVTIYYATH